MKISPIRLEEDYHLEMYQTEDCQTLLAAYRDFYPQVGYHFPWVGYFVKEGDKIVGSCGFTGQPQNGQVEIAYWTFSEFEGKGFASFACEALIKIVHETDAQLVITAKTAPEKNASTRILEKHNFQFDSVVQDHEIGDAWLWRKV